MKYLLLIAAVITLHSQSSNVLAATAPLAQTGQTNCYDTFGGAIPCAGTGQDGELMMGVAWPTPRFTVNSDPTVTDNLTGLIWSRDANMMASRDPWYDTDCTELDGRVEWFRALGYIGLLNSQNWLGHNDWRLPNRNEMESLINIQQSNTVGWLNTQSFFNVQDLSYWSSTSNAFNPFYAWSLSLDGFVSPSDSKGSSCKFVWPVRTAKPESLASTTLPSTGQTDCYDSNAHTISCTGTRQDGESQSGAAIPTPRFTDNAIYAPTDLTVTDNLTGLIWSKDANLITTRDPSFDADYTAQDGKVTWRHALDYVKKLNTESYLGHNDWRLPNRNELGSLINMQEPNPSIWLNTQMFTGVQPFLYWSSSPLSDHRRGVSAWYVNMNDGSPNYTNVEVLGYVWPVRAGLSGSFALSVSKSGSGSGTIDSLPSGIDCGSTCRAYYASGESVTLTPTADSGTVVASWSGCDSVNGNTCKVTVNAHRTVNAIFQTGTQYKLTLSFAGTGGGSINGGISCVKGDSCPPQNFEETTQVKLTPSPDSNSTFTFWNTACAVSGIDCSVTMDSDKNVIATFTEADKVRIATAKYTTLTAAFDNAATGQIQARAIEFTETLIVALPTIFKGGWNAAFDSNSDNHTTLNGMLAVGAGSLIVEGLAIR